MADLFDMLQSQVGESLVGALTGQLGGASKQQTSNGVQGAMSILMSALAKNTQSPKGASALGAALDRDHDGSILDDIAGFIGGKAPINQTRAANGSGILGHILGGQQGNAIGSLMKMSGLNQNQSTSMLAKLAPVVLGMLGKQKKSQGLDMSGLSNILNTSAVTAQKKTPGADLLTSFLDRDGDGSIKDDAARIGFGFLKSLFKRR
jgi:hypothetical protein